MAIVCSICNKRQSGWIEDFMLPGTEYDDKICVKCNENLNKLLSSKDNIEIEYFDKFLNSEGITGNAKKYLQKVIDIKDTVDSNENIPKIFLQEIKKEKEFEYERIQNIKDKLIITSGNVIEGYKILKYIDVIFEEKIVGIGIKTSLKAIGDIFASLTGDEMCAVTERIKELKSNIKDEIKEQAIKIGANAIIGLDFETTLMGGAAIMVAVNGTAVVIEKI